MKDLHLPGDAGVLLESHGAGQFVRDAAERFVHLAGVLAECSDDLHLAMPVLAQAVRSALASGRVSAAVDLCSFVSDAMAHPRAASQLRNAVAISFVSAHELRESAPGRELLSSIPRRLADALLEQEARERAV